MKRVGDMLGAPEQMARHGSKADQTRPRDADHPQSAIANRTSDEPCPICKGMGFLVLDAPPGHPDFSKAVPCRCTQARMAAEQIYNLRSVSNLGALERMTFDSFLPRSSLPEMMRRDLRQAYEWSRNFAMNPTGWLVLLGGYGAGKTHLAAAIANYQVTLGRPVLFVIVPDLLDHLRGAFAPSSETGLDERLEAVREAPLLILDDLGSHNSTPWAQEKLFQIINHRYNSRLPTVLTTNQRLDEIDPRIASRLVDGDLSQIVDISAPDFRSGQDGITIIERGGRTLSTLALHREETFDTFSLRAAGLQPDQRDNLRQAVSLAQAFAKAPTGWLIFTGTYGCGKTHLAAAIANYQIAAGQPIPMFVVVPDLLDHLRATFSPTSITTLDRLFEQVRTVHLLILDDLGTESATPWAKEKLFQLLNYRYAARLPTVITMFNKVEELPDERLASRMMDTSRCTVCGITAPSYRSGQAQQTTLPLIDDLAVRDTSRQEQRRSHDQSTLQRSGRSKSRTS